MGQKYIWQRQDWTKFDWNPAALLNELGRARKAQGQLLVQAKAIGLETQAVVVIEEAFTTSAIEGEKFDRASIRSSVAKRLGIKTTGLPPQQRNIDGLVEMLLDATQNHQKPLTAKRLNGWQAALFPSGFSGIQKIDVGRWRTTAEPMSVVSGALGKEKVHYEAPPSKSVAGEMKAFLEWWQKPSASLDGLLRAAIAHLWFVTIHPYEDGNGRLARAITDMALAQDEKTGQRLYSLSAQIMSERNAYYQILENTQKGGKDITLWLQWFLDMFTRAMARSQNLVQKSLLVANYWQTHAGFSLNERQRKVIQRLLEAEPEGFEGGLTNRKYVSLTKVSRETAKRDLAELEKEGFLKRNPGRGRSVSYSLVV